MIVKIFKPVVKGFPAVRYNYNKMDRNAGQLMKVSGFGALQGLGILKPGDYRQYLLSLAALNKGISSPQFHATISADGRSADKHQLTELAVSWMEAMGYGAQPYLVVFHKDTLNNHVHIVSCRVDRNGKKINSGFEGKRGIAALNRLMGLDESLSADKDLKDALGYRFSTKAQFALILESRGYVVKDDRLIKYGKTLLDIPSAEVQKTISAYVKNKPRAAQLKAILEKYRLQYSANLVPKTIPLPGKKQQIVTGFRSDLSDFLKVKFGIELVFHNAPGLPPYGYTLIDHARKTVFKGSEILALKELLAPVAEATKKAEADTPGPEIITDKDTIGYYQSLLNAAENYSTRNEGYQAMGLETDGEFVYDRMANTAVPVKSFDPPIRISIADDVDDQQIHGMRRRRQKKARTNTR